MISRLYIYFQLLLSTYGREKLEVWAKQNINVAGFDKLNVKAKLTKLDG